jgi:hypothetical protein
MTLKRFSCVGGDSQHSQSMVFTPINTDVATDKIYILTGIEGAFSGKGIKTVIPAKVIGKFSIRFCFVFLFKLNYKIITLRIVPNMVPGEVNQLVVSHINEMWKQRESPNKIKYRIVF